ncbi:MAG: HU family DNA-binding protein [Oscillospiraceae bacterium]|nr:HU family DNA-binding protein [Oscillospiraceae bacterium]
MTKAELVSVVAEKVGSTKKEADAMVETMFDAITEAIKKGEKVQIAGFGIFTAKERAERTCINPATKAKVKVAATRVPKFTPSKALKDAVAK